MSKILPDTVCFRPPPPLATQVGGDHYKSMAIQPVEFAQKNRLAYCEASAIKYICRHRNKNGVEDINKAIHFLQLLKQLEYGVVEQEDSK